MRGLDIGAVLAIWEQIKATEPDPSRRSITTAVSGAMQQQQQAQQAADEAAGQMEAPTQFFNPVFDIGGSDYRIIDDTDQYRNMIQRDRSGNVVPDSPVIPVGKDIGGGFLLMARGDSNIPARKIPATFRQGAYQMNFPQPASDPTFFDTLNQNRGINVTNVINQDIAREIQDLLGG